MFSFFFWDEREGLPQLFINNNRVFSSMMLLHRVGRICGRKGNTPCWGNACFELLFIILFIINNEKGKTDWIVFGEWKRCKKEMQEMKERNRRERTP